jgi:hypothetical protein
VGKEDVEQVEGGEDGDEDKQKLSDGLISPRLAVK